MDTVPNTEIKRRKGQVRPAVRVAMTAMVEQGLSIPAAANLAGLTYEGLRIALRRPHVRKAMTDVRRIWHESETLVAWKTVADLQRNAASEDVRLKSARTVIGAAGELEPDNGRSHNVGNTLVQIICAPDARVLQANDRGVVELPAWQPLAE